MPTAAACVLRTRALRQLTVAALLIVAASTAIPGWARDFAINYYERADVSRSQNMQRLTLTAHGRQFDLRLRSNAGVLAGAAAGADASAANGDVSAASGAGSAARGVRLYRGTLAGYDGSWVRVSESNGRLSGAIFDGTELWLLDSAQRLAAWLDDADETPPHDTVVFRLSEVSGSLGDVVARSAQSAPQQAIASFGPQPGRILDMALVASADFAAQHGADAHDALLEMFNIVEGIFITQAGVQLRASQIAVLDTDPPGMEQTDPSALLDSFGQHKAREGELYPLGLAHLFVGRDLDDLDPPTRTVGIANLGVVCDRRYGVGLTQATHTTVLDALIAAHEIGHNFNALHDGEGACAATPHDFIMAPKINGSTRFSQCSLEQMAPEIAAATCMQEIPPTDLQLTLDTPPPAQTSERDTIEFPFLLSNLSNSNVAGVELTGESASLSRLSINSGALDDGYCQTQPALRCVWPWFAAGASAQLRISGMGNTVGPAVLQVTVDSLHELDPTDNSLTFDFEVLPLPELVSLLTPERTALHPGESQRFEAAIVNRGALEAADVTAYIEVGAGLQLADNELHGCTQRPGFDRVRHTCPIGRIGPGRSWSFGFTAAVTADFDTELQSASFVEIYATSANLAPDDADRSARAEVTIGDTIADLGVTIDGPGLVQTGVESSWRIDVTNRGPDAAEAIRVFDDDPARTLPARAVRLQASAGECVLSGSGIEFDCAIPALEAGATASITLNATPTSTGQYFWIDAVAESDAPDGNPANDGTSLLVAANHGAAAAAPDSTAAGSNSAEAEQSSGGGGTGIGALLALGALAGLRNRSRRRRAAHGPSAFVHQGQ